MTVPYWLDAHVPKQTHEVDVAIIGGGIFGATAAYWLSKRKGLKCAVVEMRRPGWGASGRNGGFVLRGLVAYYNHAVEMYGRETAKWIFQFNEESLSYMKEFAGAYGERFHYDNCGSYLLACSLEELAHLEQSAQMMQDDGFAVDYIKHDPFDRGYFGALFNPCDAGVHSGLLVQTVFEAVGVKVFQDTEVFRIDSNAYGGRVTVEAHGLALKADRVLLLTNAYAALLEPSFVPKLRAVRGQVMVTKPLKKRIMNHLGYANYGYEYFRQLPDNRFLLGGCREPYIAQEVGFADMLTPYIQTAQRNYLKDHFPEVAGMPIDYAWSGIMAFTDDGLPLLGRLSPGVFYAVGCNGHGMGYSFGLTKLLVEHALDGRDLGVFDAHRQMTVRKELVLQ
jgi:gamma-glutamylputrescine oxidase